MIVFEWKVNDLKINFCYWKYIFVIFMVYFIENKEDIKVIGFSYKLWDWKKY